MSKTGFLDFLSPGRAGLLRSTQLLQSMAVDVPLECRLLSGCTVWPRSSPWGSRLLRDGLDPRSPEGNP